MNFKEFAGWLLYDDVFKKFVQPYKATSVTIEDLETGLNQLGYPMVKGIAENFRDGQNWRQV